MKTFSRRQFVRATAAAVAAPCIVPAHVLGQDAPSKKITVGFIGTGGHGTDWNLPACLKQPDARVLTVCDVDDTHLQRAKDNVNKHYGLNRRHPPD